MREARTTDSRRKEAPARSRVRVAGLVLGSALLLGACFHTRAHAAPPAGTPIVSIATATAIESGSGATISATSNPVTAIVQPLEQLAVGPNRMLLASPGSSVLFAHRVHNAGNDVAIVQLDAIDLPGDGFTLSAIAMTHDRDRDGIISALDAPIAPGGTLMLAAGDSADVLLQATVPITAPAASFALLRLAAITQAQAVSGSATDTVRTPAISGIPTLAFFSAPDYARTIRSVTIGSRLHVQALAPLCNSNPLLPDTVAITLRSARTSDVESFVAIETGASTGVFRLVPGAPSVSALTTAALIADGQVATLPGDRIEATLLGCGATATRASVWVEPGGIVFDSRRNLPMAGARVTLIDESGAGNGGSPGGPARVWLEDGVTSAPSEAVTSADGRFSFANVASSVYRIVVTPPVSHRFPSNLPFAQLPTTRTLDAAGSFGLPFAIATSGDPVVLDVPLDRHVVVALFAEKRALRTEVEPGDLLDYEVRVANRSDSVQVVTLGDRLPPGFQYAAGSARRDGTAIADPSGGGGPALDFALGSIAPGATSTLRYRVLVGPGAQRGMALNEAVAASGAVHSNTARAAVRVRGDAFSDDAIITGVVWFAPHVDAALAAQAAEHPEGVVRGPGLPSVRVLLDDGTWAITDGQGRFRFTSVAGRTHAIKIDPTTLPPGARVLPLSNRESGTPGLQSVDLMRGGMRRVEFAVWGDTTTAREVHDRRFAKGPRRDELGRALSRATDVSAEDRPSPDPRSLPASRIVTGESALPVWDRPASSVGIAASAASTSPARLDPASLEAILPGLDTDLGFIGLADLDTVSQAQIAVRVKGRMGTPLRLRVNGENVPESRVGRRLTAARIGLEAWEYLGITLQPGLNVLEVAPPRSIGRVALRLVAPGPLSRVALIAPKRAPADGHRATPIVLQLADVAGVPVGERTLVTLETDRGRIEADDLDPTTPGIQVAVEGGRLSFALVSPPQPGDARLQASTGALRAWTDVEFVPELRPLLAVGLLEGVISLSDVLRRGGAVRSVPRTGFELPIEQWSSISRDGRASAEARGALYLKGRISDGVQLTLGYDSDRPAEQRVLRDLDTQRGYLVTGDASVVGYDAQSAGRLYAKLERRDASLLYGDLVTGTDNGASLTRYARTLTGAEARYGEGRARVTAFTSRQRSRRAAEELPGRGISGPYLLRHAPILANSERVELVVRDRAHPAVVLRADVMQRFVDYELDAMTGRLLFRMPIASVDPLLDPMSIRVTYEVEDGGDPAWVHGVTARVPVSERLTLGGVYVDDHDPARRYELRGASAHLLLAPRTRIDAEWATSQGIDALREASARQEGDAGRIELNHEQDAWRLRAWGTASGTGFENTGASIGAGRREAGLRFSRKLAGRMRLLAEALHSGDADGREQRTGALASLDRTLNDWTRGELGVRVADAKRQGQPDEPLLVALRAKLSGQLPRHPEWNGYLEAEQDVREADRRLAAVGGEYRFHPRGRLHARHEIASSLGGAWALTRGAQQLASVVGVEAELGRDARVFSEYRLADAVADRDAQAAVGLRNGWQLDNGMRVGTSFERVHPIAGPAVAQGPNTALTASVDWSEDPLWKGSARMELRTSRASDQVLQSMAAAVRLDSNWTALARHLLTLTDARGSGDEARERLALALAYRPSAKPWDALMRYEFRYDREAPEAAARHRRLANVVSMHGAARVLPRTEASLAWAGKLTRHQSEGAITAGGAQWLRARISRDLARDWDVSLSASALTGRRLSQYESGVGAEIGRQLPGGVWLSGGWNLYGYSDDELSGEEWTRQGGFLRIRARLDEKLFERLRGSRR